MLELLLMIRKIIRPICKLGVLVFGLMIVMVFSGKAPNISFIIISFIMLPANILALTYYDRMLFRLAEKMGYELYLEK